MVKLVCVDFPDLMVTSIFPFFFSPVCPPSLLECCPALHCGCMSRAGNDVWGFLLWWPMLNDPPTCRSGPILLHSSVCLLIWFSFRKFPWCTVLRQPLCLQQQHLPQVFPSLQQPQPTRFANLQLCSLQTTRNRCFNEHGGLDLTSCWPTHSLTGLQHGLISP